MAARFARLLLVPDLILSSPAKRAKKTALYMAKGTGYPVASISFDEGLYLGSMACHLRLLQKGFAKDDTLFLVGHNYTITELARYLCGVQIGDMPTCGVVAVEYAGQGGFSAEHGCGKLLFVDFPKNTSVAG